MIATSPKRATETAPARKIYGSLELRQRAHPPTWVIRCEPHVRLRLKRVFAKVDHLSFEEIELSNTLENCADLRWFLERYPMKIGPGARALLEERADLHLAQTEGLARLFAEGYVPPTFNLALPPRQYQALGADLILRTGGALIADDLGLGKTVTAIATLTDPRTLPALIVTLSHLPKQWEAELARFAPSLRVHILRTARAYDVEKAMRKARRQDRTADLPGMSGFPDVLITNYHKLAGWADQLAGRMQSVIFDEVQELRHGEGGKQKKVPAKYLAAKHIAGKAAFRSGLSATPIYNFGGEMHSVIEVLRPGALGTRSEFLREWCGIHNQALNDPKAFGLFLRSDGLMLRRTRAEVGRELPDLQKVLHHVDAEPGALEAVQDRAAELARIILAQGGGFDPKAKFRASEEISYLLRQATGIAKAPFVAEFVRLLVESGEKVVLYGWHRAVYDIWLERLKDFKPMLFTGSESAPQKQRAKEAFLDPHSGTRVLIMSLRAGAGLDGLQGHCRTVVFGELDWSPGVHEQCIGRIHRDGQAEKVLAYYLIAESGSDPVIVGVLGLKRAQVEGIRNPDAELLERLDTGGEHSKRLAEAYLKQRGLPLPPAPTPEAPHGD